MQAASPAGGRLGGKVKADAAPEPDLAHASAQQ